MPTGCLRHTELPHTTKLHADLVYHFDRVSRFYGFDHNEAASYQAAAGQIDFTAAQRASLVETLEEQNGGSPQLSLLAQPGTAAVVTGQQVGLFSGPCYTIYKALSAARLARRLTEQRIPAVTVFWLATEDHDLAEVNHCWSFDGSLRPVRIAFDMEPGGQRPVGGVAPAQYPVAALRESLAAWPHGEEITALVESCYSGGRPLGEAFGNLLRKLLAGYGILFLDPMRPAVRSLAAPLIRRAVERAPDLYRLLSERSRELESSGYHAQVLVEPETSLFFVLEGGQRLALRRNGGDYVAGGQRWDAARLAARAETLSPNVLLRPIVQDYLLPTIAYVGGPAELAYLAQCEVAYRALLGRMPVAVPRSGFTLLDARAAKLLSRYELPVTACFHGVEPLRESIAGRLVPPELRAEFDLSQQETLSAIDRLRGRVAAMDGSLGAAVDKSRAKIAYQLAKIEGKVARESLRRDQRARDGAAYLFNLIHPEKHLQERLYSILPFLARHGTGLIDRLFAHVRLDCPDHIVLDAD